ncbi:MAG TPA: alpha/beta hydrolase [Myxococcota bacterium]
MSHTLERLTAHALRRLPDRWVLRWAGEPPACIRGRTLDPRVHVLTRRARERTPFHQLSPAQARSQAAAMLSALDGPRRPMERIERRAVPGSGGAIPVRVYHPPGLDGPRPLLLYFHQGGCVLGDLDWCETFCTLLAETARCLVMSVDYRLGPEQRFPAAHEDAVAAFRWATEHAGEVGGDARRIAVGGDSAGGTLAAAVAQEMKRSGGPLPIFQLLVYPWLLAYADNAAYRDFAEAFPLTPEGVRWCLSHYLDDAAHRDDRRVSPLLETDLAGLPPALVATAGFDPLCDEGEIYARRLEEAGVSVRYRCYESLCHGFSAMSGAVPAARAALEEIAWDLERALTRGA